MTDDTTTSNPAPGWYTDPVAEADHRWWDGNAWTTQTRTAAPAPVFSPPPLPVPAPAPQPVTVAQPYAAVSSYRPAPRNGAATTGLILGAASVVLPGLILSIAAFIVNGIGLRRARRYEDLGDGPVGRKRARWGLTLGIIGLLLTGAVAVYGAGQLGYGPLAVSPTPAERAHFLSVVHKNIKTKLSDSDLLAVGESFCDIGRKKEGRLTYLKLALDGPLSPHDSAFLSGVAIATICTDQDTYLTELMKDASQP